MSSELIAHEFVRTFNQRDLDGFEVAPAGKPTSQTVDVPAAVAPEGVTLDDLE